MASVQKLRLTKSEQMARVRSANTGLEIQFRKQLWASGLRYRLHKRLPGTPDVAFVSAKIAVFIDGCFWHGCKSHYRAPVQNSEFWRAKLERNVSRDVRVGEELAALGWRVVRVWEHEISDRRFLQRTVQKLARMCSSASVVGRSRRNQHR